MKGRKSIAVMGAALLTMATTMTVFAGSWKQDNVGWWYQRDNGSYPSNGWEWIDGNNDGVSECYYFNPAGYCLMNTSTPDGYKVDSNGAWIDNGVIQTKNMKTSSGTAGSNANNSVQPTKYSFTAEEILSVTGVDKHNYLKENDKDALWSYDFYKCAYELGIADKAIYAVSAYKNDWCTLYESYMEVIEGKQSPAWVKDKNSLTFDEYVKHELDTLKLNIMNGLYAENIEEVEGDILRFEELIKELPWSGPYINVDIIVMDVPLLSEESVNEMFERLNKRVDGSNGVYVFYPRMTLVPREERIIGGKLYVTEEYQIINITYTNRRDLYLDRDKYIIKY